MPVPSALPSPPLPLGPLQSDLLSPNSLPPTLQTSLQASLQTSLQLSLQTRSLAMSLRTNDTHRSKADDSKPGKTPSELISSPTAVIRRTIRSSRKRRTTRRPLAPRVLFPSDPNSSEPGENVEEELKRISESVHARARLEFRNRWNYDIEEDKPVEGRYKWSTS